MMMRVGNRHHPLPNRVQQSPQKFLSLKLHMPEGIGHLRSEFFRCKAEMRQKRLKFRGSAATLAPFVLHLLEGGAPVALPRADLRAMPQHIAREFRNPEPSQ